MSVVDTTVDTSARVQANPSAGTATGIDTSIVMATCSRARLLRAALESLFAQSFEAHRPTEIIIVDDGSTDQTADILREMQAHSPVPFTILQGERRGISHARNLGCSHARGTWIASFDDDQIALPNWLKNLRDTADSTGAACVGGALALQLPEGLALDSLGPRVRSILGEHLPRQSAGPYTGVSHPATNNCLIRREVFEQIGGYDLTFIQGGEDKYFFRRVQATGHRIVFAPLSQALHVMVPNRLTNTNLRWTSLRIGTSDVRVEHLRRPFWGPVRLAAFRTCVALLRDFPRLIFSLLNEDGREEFDSRCSLWYTQGVLRAMPDICLGRGPTESHFLRSMDFRRRNGERGEHTVYMSGY